MRRFLIWTTTAAAALALPAVAIAAVPGFAVDDVNLHAGPGGVYPVVDTVPAGARLRIDGCIGRYAWCNVSWNGVWGWVPADDLQALYRGRRVLVLDYGPEIGLPIIGFSVDSYWGEHYRNRGFYARIHDFDHGAYAHGAVGGRVGANGRTGVNGRTNATVGAGGQNERGSNAAVGAGVRNENGGRNGAAIRDEGSRSGATNRSLRKAANVNATPAHPRETTGAAPRAEFGGRTGGGGGGGQTPAMPAGGGGGAPHAAGGGHGGGGGGGESGRGGGGSDHRH